MRVLKWLFLACLLLILALPLALLLFGIQSEPAVVASHNLSQQHVRRIKQVLRDVDPRRLRVGAVRTTYIEEADINLILNYGAARLPGSAAHVDLQSGAANMAVALKLDSLVADYLHGYLNLSWRVLADQRQLQVVDFRIGRIALPNVITRLAQTSLHRLLQQRQDYPALLDSIQAFTLEPKHLSVTYHWQQELKDQLRLTGTSLLFTAAQQEDLKFYAGQIRQLDASLPRNASLAQLLVPLFEQAYARAQDDQSAAEENRNMLIALSFFVAGVDTDLFLSAPSNDEVQAILQRRFLRFTLGERQDLAKHFTISAGISASAGTHIANAAGLFKELRDSQGGSGFSFADLAADRAGTRLGELAVDPVTARELQQRMILASNETAFMPDVSRLPEGIQEREFDRTYQNMDNAAYQSMSEEIERRIDNSAVFAALNP